MVAASFIAFSFTLSAIYLFFYLYLDRAWQVIRKQSHQKTSENKCFLSVVVPFRNEITHIESFLLSIESQNYAREYFELILVDDHSEDISRDFIDTYSNDSNINIRVIALPEGITSKKQAIELGIKSSVGELIVTSDVDTSRSNTWLSSISNHYNSHRSSMSIAPVALINDGSFLSAFQAIEFNVLQYVGLCYAQNDNPVLCNGANLIYEKKKFLDLGGFENSIEYTSGDDLFLMLDLKKDKFSAIDVISNTDTLVQSYTLPGFKALLHQKVRWASKLKGMNDNSLKFLGALSLFSWTYCILSLFFEFIYLESLSISWIFILLKMSLDYSMARRFSKKYHQEFSNLHFVLSFVLYPFYYFLILVMSVFSKVNWKGRPIKQ